MEVEGAGGCLSIPYRRSKRARRLIVRLTPAQEIELVIPQKVTLTHAREFLQRSLPWINANMPRKKLRESVRDGMEISVLGNIYSVRLASSAGITYQNEGEIVVHARPGNHAIKLKEFLAMQLQQQAREIALVKAAHLNKSFSRIIVRDVKGYWGSCSPSGALTFAFQLVFAPLWILDYIVAHEVAHLIEKGHNRAFWNLTSQLCPDVKLARAWLRKHGHELNIYEI